MNFTRTQFLYRMRHPYFTSINLSTIEGGKIKNVMFKYKFIIGS